MVQLHHLFMKPSGSRVYHSARGPASTFMFLMLPGDSTMETGEHSQFAFKIASHLRFFMWLICSTANFSDNSVEAFGISRQGIDWFTPAF
jgi:hypothetical protein